MTEDSQIVELYFSRSESAISETKNKYGNYCRYIANQILRDDEDAKEIENDVYMKLWNSIPPNRPSALKAFLGTVCRRLALNRYEASHTKKRDGGIPAVLDELAECISDTEGDFADEIFLRDALNRFLAGLPQKERMLFVRRYWYISDAEEIAQAYAMSKGNVSVSLFRTRQKLKEYLIQEGIYEK